jgi:hypothetical protein
MSKTNFGPDSQHLGNILCVREQTETNKATNESTPRSLVDFQKVGHPKE